MVQAICLDYDKSLMCSPLEVRRLLSLKIFEVLFLTNEETLESFQYIIWLCLHLLFSYLTIITLDFCIR